MLMPRLFLFVACLSVLAGCRQSPSGEAPNLGPTADAGMVVSAHPEASLIGAKILADGGNAIDAMVATHAALAVAYPIAGNIGGGGFLVFRREDGMLFSLDFREKAPAAAHRDVYLDADGRVLPEATKLGFRSAGVPGSVAGLWEAHGRFGSMDWAALWQPAVDLAARGFPITASQAEQLNKHAEVFWDQNPGNEYLWKEGAWQAGDTLRQTDLAATLARIRDQGPEDFYRGQTAARIQQAAPGWITSADLAEYRSVWRAPIAVPYDSYTVVSMAPPSSGGIALAQLLTMVEPFPLQQWGHNSSRTVHVLAEAERRVYADRAQHLGDPDYWAVPVDTLLDKAYLRERMADFNLARATPSSAVKAGVFAPGASQAPAATAESDQTTHYSIVDRLGNAVSVTTTINGRYGSKVFVDGAGFLLNNEMDDFSAKPGVPNQYGLIGGEANAIAPGKRMLSSMTPAIVEKNGRLYAVVGSPGGARIITTVFQTVLNLVEFDMTMAEAVNAPRVHHQQWPDSIRIEEGALPDSTLAALRAKGHAVYTDGSMGRVDAIRILSDGRMEGGADPRGDDRAVGVQIPALAR